MFEDLFFNQTNPSPFLGQSVLVSGAFYLTGSGIWLHLKHNF